MEKFFSTFKVAKICQVSPASVSRWIREGKLASSVTAGGHHRVGAEALSAFLKALRMPIPPELTSLKAHKVLIADSDSKIRRIVRRHLEQSFERLNVEEAADGFEAGWKAHALKPRLIILDYSIIPSAHNADLNGFLKTLCDSTQASVILTGSQKEMHGIKKQNPGRISAVLIKPFDVYFLKQAVRDYFLGEGKDNAVAS